MRITKWHLPFRTVQQEDGSKRQVAEFEIPEFDPDAMKTSLTFERLNDMAMEVYQSEVFWTEQDDQRLVMESLDFIEQEEDS